MDFWNWLMQQRPGMESGSFMFQPDMQLDPSQVRDRRAETQPWAPWLRAPYGGGAYDGPGGFGYPQEGAWSDWYRLPMQRGDNWMRY